MIAIEISSPGGADVLRAVERPMPEPESGEVLIRVEAAGVARADVMQRQGKYSPPPGASDIPGLDVAGTLDGFGARVHNWEIWGRVCALLTRGGYAGIFLAAPLQGLPLPGG